MLASQWLANTRAVMDDIERTQTDNMRKAAELMADSIGAGRWVHTFGCGHATIPVEEMYPVPLARARHSIRVARTLFDLADVVIDTKVPAGNLSVALT